MIAKIRHSPFISTFVIFSFILLSIYCLSRLLHQEKAVLAATNSPRVYVTVRNPLGVSNVSVVDTGNNNVVASIPVGDDPFDVKMSSDYTRLYVANRGGNSVSVVDTASNSVIATILLGGGGSPNGISLNSTGTRLYAANEGSNTVVAMDTTTNTVINTIPVGSWPTAIAVKPNSTLVYVAHSKWGNKCN
jgi:YVTN family beta-propeller protein